MLFVNYLPMIQQLFFDPFANAVVAAGLFMLLCLIRLAGFRLLLFADEPAPQGAAFQISIRGLLAVTILIAMLFGLGHNLQEPAWYRLNGEWFPELGGGPTSLRLQVLVISTGLALFAGGVALPIWACLSLGEVWSRLGVGAVACVSLGLLMAYYLHGSPLLYVAIGFFAAVLFGVVSATLLVFRYFGYRLSRMEVVTPAEAEAPSMNC